MPLPTLAEFQTAVEDIKDDGDILHAIVHGPASGGASLVATEGGNVRTIARAIDEIALATPFGPTTPVEGEVGVVNNAYPVGDVRRYGMFPDGHIVSGVSTTNGNQVITGSAGDFALSEVGMYVWGPQITATGSLITAKAGDSSTITVNPAPTGTSGAAKLIIGGRGIIEPTTYNTIRDNGLNPRINLYFPPGLYVSSFNMGSDMSGTPDTPWRAYFDHAAFAGVFHLTQGVSHLRCGGDLILYDRFGVTEEPPNYCANIEFENIWCLSDPDRNMSFVGTGNGRGVHTGPIDGFRAKLIYVEDCYSISHNGSVYDADTSLAAFAIEQKAFVRGGFKVDMLWAANAGGNAVILSGVNFDIDHIRVDAWGREPSDYLTNGGVAALGAPDVEINTAVAMRRASGRIGTIEVRQGNATPDNTNGQRAVLLSDTGDTEGDDDEFQGMEIGRIYVEAGSALASCGGGVVFGCKPGGTNNDLRAHYDIGLIEVVLIEGNALNEATDSLVQFNDILTGGAVASYNIGKIRIINPQGYNAIGFAGESAGNKLLRIGAIDVLGYTDAGSLLNFVGSATGTARVFLGPINFSNNNAYATRAILHFQNLEQLVINGVYATATAVDNRLIRIEGCKDVEVSNVRSRGYRGVNPIGCISLETNNRLRLRNVDLVGTDAANSVGIHFGPTGPHTDYSFYDVYVQDFALGTDKEGAPTFTRFAVHNSQAVSCASASDLASGDTASKVNQTLVTA